MQHLEGDACQGDKTTFRKAGEYIEHNLEKMELRRLRLLTWWARRKWSGNRSRGAIDSTPAFWRLFLLWIRSSSDKSEYARLNGQMQSIWHYACSISNKSMSVTLYVQGHFTSRDLWQISVLLCLRSTFMLLMYDSWLKMIILSAEPKPQYRQRLLVEYRSLKTLSSKS